MAISATDRPRFFAVCNPRTGETLQEVPNAGAVEALAALDAIAGAAAAWGAWAPRDRGRVLHDVVSAMRAGKDRLAHVIHLETGKPFAEAFAEVAYAQDYVTWYADESGRIGGRYGERMDRGRLLTRRTPVGPCLLITPWNFPLAMAARKLGPALAAGCTAIIKPAEQAPLSTLLFHELLREAGVPDGVVKVLTTQQPAEVATALLGDSRLRKLSFTGSTPVGRQLLTQAAQHVLRTSLELGGDAPFLVFADADLDAAAASALVAKLRNAGQACTAANRFLVQRSVAADFTSRLVEAMRAHELGPLIDDRAREKVTRLVSDALARGATCHLGGRPRRGAGYFYEPTVLSDVPAHAVIHDEEIFGPVAVIRTFEDEAEAIRLANDSEHGLAAYVHRGDIGSAMATAEQLDVGMVGVNTGAISDAAAPFGGVKASGLGREGGPEGIEEYLETRYYALDWGLRRSARSTDHGLEGSACPSSSGQLAS